MSDAAYHSSGESGITYDRDHKRGSPGQQQHTPPESPNRRGTYVGVDKDGNRVERWDRDEAPGIRTHDYSNEDEVNAALFGEAAVKPKAKRSSTSKSYKELAETDTTTTFDENGNRVERWNKDEAPRIRTHDHSNEDEVNAALFGEAAVKPKAKRSSTSKSYKELAETETTYDEDGNKVERWNKDAAPGIRTHDHSNQEEINEKLFGKNAPTPSYAKLARTDTSTTYDKDGNKVEMWNKDEAPGVRTHDHCDEDAVNAALFGKPARRTTSRSNSDDHTEEYRNADGDREQVLKDGVDVGIRTHDYSNQDEINARLFGKGARNE